jgi:hypothetical protein
MNTITIRKPKTMYGHYPKVERVSQKTELSLTEREKTLKNIDILTQYREDLKAGKPVENLSPSNDPYFLNPEVIDSMIKGEKDSLDGKGRIVNSIEDIIGEWDTK